MKNLIAVLFLSMLLVPLAHAEQAKTFGDVTIHYNAMSTDELLPEVAKQYQLSRSRNRGMLTISVLKAKGSGDARPGKAEVKVSIPTLTGQSREVPMREFIDGAAVYYIGEYRISPPQTLKFVVSAKPEGGGQPLKFDFAREFFR